MEEKENTRSQPFRRINPGAEHLIGMLIDYRTSIEQYKLRFEGNGKKLTLLALCEHKIDEAERAVLVTGLFTRRVFVAWDIFHQLAADMILFMDAPELCACGRKLCIDIRASSLPETTKTDSILHLDETLKKIQGANTTETDIERARQALRTVTFTLNTHVDSIFWDIWTRKFICVIYTVLLLALLLYFLGHHESLVGSDYIRIGGVALLGAMGGLLSGIFSGDIQSIAKGHFWVSTLYYSLVRPVQGALAAMAMFWMLQSEYLIKIVPPLDTKPGVFTSMSACTRADTSQTPGVKGGKKTRPEAFTNNSSNENSTPEKKSSVIVLNAAKGKQIYLYILVLLLAGFSGDKMLKTVSDKVTGRLFTEADKTKEAK
jgi:hypothetical protein